MLPSFPRRPWEESITSVIGERLRPNQPSLREREHLLRRSDRAGEGFTFLFSFLHICWTCCFMVVRTEGQNGRSCRRCWRKVEVLVDPGALHLPDHLRWSVPPSGAPRLLRQLQLDFFVIAFVIVGTIRSLKTTVGCLCCGGSCPVGRRCEAKLKETSSLGPSLSPCPSHLLLFIRTGEARSDLMFSVCPFSLSEPGEEHGEHGSHFTSHS